MISRDKKFCEVSIERFTIVSRPGKVTMEEVPFHMAGWIGMVSTGVGMESEKKQM